MAQPVNAKKIKFCLCQMSSGIINVNKTAIWSLFSSFQPCCRQNDPKLRP